MMIELMKYSLGIILFVMNVIDWIYEKADVVHSRFYEDDTPEFLKEDYKTFQISGRPRKDV